MMGYEHNINYKGKIFTVVTTDLGNSIATIKTSIFIEGRVLVSIEKSYKALVNNPLKDILVKKIMKNQHGDVLKKLVTSSYDGLINEVIINQDTTTSIEEKLRIYRENRLKMNSQKEDTSKKDTSKKDQKEDTQKEDTQKEEKHEKMLKSEKTLDNLILNYFE